MNAETFEELNRKRWKNRRIMTWVTLVVATILYPALSVYKTDLVEMSMAVYTFCTAVVGVYIGFATADDKWNPNLHIATLHEYVMLSKIRWSHRRWMTWTTLATALVYFPALTMLDAKMLDMSTAFYTFCTAVVSVYIGFSTADDKWSQQQRPKS
jgi:Mn2+/Fe2+ NRAMP family transporter